MDSQITTTPTTPPQTLTARQVEALKGTIRAAAASNPAGMEHGARCRDLTQTLCDQHRVRRLADLPADLFACAMKTLSGLAVPQRMKGRNEAAVSAAGARLDAALAGLQRAREAVAGFRHEAGGLIVPFKDALGVSGKGGVLEAHVQEGLGYLLAMPLLDLEDMIRRAQGTLQILQAYMPSIARALDERRDVPAMLGAD